MGATKNSLLYDIAFALNDHESVMGGGIHYVDLTTGGVTFIGSDEMVEEDISEEDIKDYPDWEQEIIRTYLTHNLIRIDPIDSSESFHVMESFAETRSPKEQHSLYNALNRRHPFSGFRYACEDLGIIQEWYDFKNEVDIRRAEEWLEENNLKIEDGKIR